MKKDVTCKEIEKSITDFIHYKMNDKELEKFIFHVKHCENCYEELTIQFLITEGMARLEDGRAFDLQKALKHRILESEKNILRHKKVRCILITMEVVAVISVILILVLCFL